MSVIDIIRRKQVLDSPETVNMAWASPSVSLDDRQGEWSLSFKYENGIGVDMKVYLQLSVDDVNFGDVVSANAAESYEVQITDTSGVVIFDVDGTGAQYARIRVAVTTGSIDAVEIKYLAKQGH